MNKLVTIRVWLIEFTPNERDGGLSVLLKMQMSSC